jgi:Flp pilus assembly pilin Flp
MLKRKKCHENAAQIMVEYTLVIGLVVVMLIAMLPMLNRMSQAMIKVAVDQVGNQVNGDQEFGEDGHLVHEYASTRADTHKILDHQADRISFHYNDTVGRESHSLMNLGTIPGPPDR